MIAAGELRSRLTLQVPIEKADGQGGVVRSYASLGSIWAKVELLESRENIAADAAGAALRARITLRGPLALSLQHRLFDGEKVYRICGFREDGRFVVVDAELRLG